MTHRKSYDKYNKKKKTSRRGLIMASKVYEVEMIFDENVLTEEELDAFFSTKNSLYEMAIE